MASLGEADVVVVGAGISGLTFARAYAEKNPNREIHVVERRNHIGGNCHDCVNDSGLFVQSYGPHIFHTNDVVVWDFVSRFTDWIPYKHKVLAKYHDAYYPMPINRTTINRFFGTDLKTDDETRRYLDAIRVPVDDIKNSRDVVVSVFGQRLYEAFVAEYSKKQWGVYPDELAASVLQRLPIRFDDNDYYYDALHQGMPAEGFTRMFERMADRQNITVSLGTDFLDVAGEVGDGALIVSTSRIDEFFGFKYGRLPYRFSRFEFETFGMESFQPNSVVNYTDSGSDFIRVTEFKKLYLQNGAKTTICREYAGDNGVATYPMPTSSNQSLVGKYLNLTPKNMHFIGRLGLHRYLDMDKACGMALDLAGSI